MTSGLVRGDPATLDRRLLDYGDLDRLYRSICGYYEQDLYEVLKRLPQCEHGCWPIDEWEQGNQDWFLNTYACEPERGDAAVICFGGFHDLIDAYWMSLSSPAPVYCLPYYYREPGIVARWP